MQRSADVVPDAFRNQIIVVGYVYRIRGVGYHWCNARLAFWAWSGLSREGDGRSGLVTCWSGSFKCGSHADRARSTTPNHTMRS